jgi:hypothetical protein
MGLVAGAIKAVTPHPNDANVVYIGAVNGGVWKTTDASSKRPHWQPLTDDQKSLSIGALAFDPTDRTYQTLVAGTGRFSSDAGIGSALIGLLRTTDGGASWTTIPATRPVSDANITSIVPRSDVIVISSDRGVLRLANGQWKRISLPQTVEAGGAVFGLYSEGQAEIDFSIAADPQNPNIVYVGGDAQPAFDESNPSPPRSGCRVRSGSWPNSVGACTYSGRLFRIDASLPPGSQATSQLAMAGSSPSMTRARPGFPTAIRAITISATFAGSSSTPSPSGRSMCR